MAIGCSEFGTLFNFHQDGSLFKFTFFFGGPDKSQQAFSYENVPCLHNGIPALESLHRAWSSRIT
jgi:hypothetical protein